MALAHQREYVGTIALSIYGSLQAKVHKVESTRHGEKEVSLPATPGHPARRLDSVQELRQVS